jgi:hypothetical protein
MKKLLSILSIACISTSIFVNPAFARPVKLHGNKGIYTIDIAAGTYRACLYKGGCISLGPKNFTCAAEPGTDVCEFSSWRNGPYTYTVFLLDTVTVTKNGREIFRDVLK